METDFERQFETKRDFLPGQSINKNFNSTNHHKIERLEVAMQQSEANFVQIQNASLIYRQNKASLERMQRKYIEDKQHPKAKDVQGASRVKNFVENKMQRLLLLKKMQSKE